MQKSSMYFVPEGPYKKKKKKEPGKQDRMNL